MVCLGLSRFVLYHLAHKVGMKVGMVRSLNKLSDVSARAAKAPGRYSDGGGLYLSVGPTGSKSWVFVWTRSGKKREMGLGAYPTVTVAKARTKAATCRMAVEEGRDPIAERAKEAEPTFGECADRYIASIRSEWRNATSISGTRPSPAFARTSDLSMCRKSPPTTFCEFFCLFGRRRLKPPQGSVGGLSGCLSLPR